MKIFNTDEYSPPAGTLVYRQSVMGTVIGSLIMLLIIAGLPFVYIKFEFPIIFMVLILFLGWLVIPVLLTTMVAVFRKSNWTMVIDDTGLWINLRSFTSYRYPNALTVVHLDYQEIKQAYPQVQDPVQSGNNSHSNFDNRKKYYLMLELNLSDSTTLKEAVREENNRRDEKKILFGLGTSSTKIGSSNVFFNSGDLLKITWVGKNGEASLRPKLEHALEKLAYYVSVGEEVRLSKKPDETSTAVIPHDPNAENEIL